MANNQDTLRETQQLNQALEETRWKMSQLGSDTVRVQNDVSNAMSRVTGQLRQLGNTMVPVANVGLNLFSRLLRVLQPLAEGVASFVSTLFGLRLSGTVRSLNKASNALSKTGKSAKSAAKATKSLAKAQKDLMSFDQINKLSDRKSSSGGGYKSTGGKGKGSGGGLGGLRGMNIEVSQWALKVRKVLADIWKPFQKAWKTHGETVMKSFQNAMGKIGKLVKSVGSTWLSIWKSKAGEKIVGAVLKIVSKVCDVVGTLAERFRIAWESCGNGERIVNAVYGILEDALEWVGRLADSTAQWAQNLDFGPALESLGGLLESFRNLADVAEDRLADAYENVLLPLAQWAIHGQPGQGHGRAERHFGPHPAQDGQAGGLFQDRLEGQCGHRAGQERLDDGGGLGVGSSWRTGEQGHWTEQDLEHGEGLGERAHRRCGEQAGGAGEERMEQRGSLGGQCADFGEC